GPAVREPAALYEATRSLASPPVEERPPSLSRREVLLLKGFVSTLLLEADVAAAVFSFWTDAAAEISISARQPLSAVAQEELLRSLDAAFASACPGASAPADRRVEQEFPVGKRPGELGAFAGAQSSIVFSGTGTLLLTVVFARPPDPANQPALAQVHRLVQSVIRGSRDVEAYRISYRSLVNFLLEPGRRPYPQLKAHSLSVASLCRKFAAALGLGAEIVEQL